MELQETQANMEMSPEEAKAALGNATFLQDQLLQQSMPQEAPQEGQEAPGQELAQPVAQEPQIDSEALKSEIINEVKTDITKEVKELVKKEMEGLKTMLSEALNDEQGED